MGMAVSDSMPSLARITQCGFRSFLRNLSQESVHLSSSKVSGSTLARWVADTVAEIG